MVRKLWIAAAIAALVVAQGASGNQDSFPRLGGVNNGGNHDYDNTSYQAALAKLNVSMLGIWPGWDSGKAMTMDQAVRNIKKINPNSHVFLYENSMEVSATTDTSAPVYDKVDQMKWWLSPIGTGTKVQSEYGVQTGKYIYQINTTLFTGRDSNGYQEWEWHARWVIDQLYKPTPSIDGFFEDNVFYEPRISGDWNL